MSSSNGVVTVTNEDEVSAKRLDILLRHIQNVREDCLLLGERLIEQGEEKDGRDLIANGLIHDNSKLRGIEWLYLHGDVKDTNPTAFKLAAYQHIHTNPHHPEYWHGIDNMPDVYIAEMVCDWKARSNEFGNDFWEWVRTEGVRKYEFSTSGRVYKLIKKYAELVFEPKFR